MYVSGGQVVVLFLYWNAESTCNAGSSGEIDGRRCADALQFVPSVLSLSQQRTTHNAVDPAHTPRSYRPSTIGR